MEICSQQIDDNENDFLIKHLPNEDFPENPQLYFFMNL